MLEYNEIRERKRIVLDGEPYEVISSHVFRKQQRKLVNATKLKNLFTGKVTEYSFHVSDKVDEAELTTQKAKFLYFNRNEYWFCDEKDAAKRFKLTEEQIGDKYKYMKANALVSVVSFNEKVIGVEMPIKVELKVVEAAPAVKGNTIQGGLKQVKLETGAMINVPMFINEGDVLRINTDSGDYVERV